MESGILNIARGASRSWRRSPVGLVILVIALLFGGSAHAQYVQAPPWQSKNTVRAGATLDLDFVHDRYFLNGTTYNGIANFAGCQTTCPVTGVTFSRSGTTTVTPTGTPFYLDATQGQAFVSRASSATYFDSSGNLQTASTNTARSATFTYSGSAWVANSGTFIEPAASNGIRNNTMVGVTTFSNTQLATNGTFASCSGATCTGWSTGANGGTGSVSFASNTATITGDGTHSEELYQALTTVTGTTYAVSITVGAGSAPTFQAGTTSNGTNLQILAPTPVSTTSTYLFTATTTTSYIEIDNTSASAANVTSVSIVTVGALPTDWSIGSVNGISAQVIGSGTEDNINYVDVRFYGTPIVTAFDYVNPEAVCTAYPASQFSVVTYSSYIKLQAGSLTNVSFPQVSIHAKEAGCADPATNVSSTLNSISNAALSTQRWSVSTTAATFSNSLTAYASPGISIEVTAGNPIDVTFRIGMPQIEAGSTTTSVIATSGSTATRAADLYSVPSGGTYFNGAGVLKTAPVNTPRLDYGSSGGNYPLGVLIEESRTNSVTNNTMQGVALPDGVERTTSGTFSGCSGATCTGWTTNLNGGTGTVSYGSNTATLTGDGTNAASIYEAIPTVSGCTYTMVLTVGAGHAVTIQAGTTAGGTTIMPANNAAANTTTSFAMKAAGTPTYVQINNSSATPATISSLSVMSSGCLPTGWYVSNLIIPTVIGTGTDNGISYVDVNFVGSTASDINFNNTNNAAAQNQVWNVSSYLKLIGGSFSNVTLSYRIFTQDNTQTVINAYTSAVSPVPTSSSLAGQRSYYSLTLPDAGTAYAFARLVTTNVTGAYNFTLRIGMPQFEYGNLAANPTSTIPTFGSAVTRSGDAFYVLGTANGGWLTNNVGTLGTVGSYPYYANDNSNQGFAGLDDSSSSNSIFTRVSNSGFRGVGMYTGAASSYSQNYSAYTPGATTKSAFAFSTNGGGDEGSADDGVLQSDGVVALPTTQSRLTVGHTRGASGDLDGYVQRVWYMPTRQPDSSLADYSR